MKDKTWDSLFAYMEETHRGIIEKLDLIGKILKETNEEVCRIQCKTPEGHRENLKRARARAWKLKKSGSKNPLDKYIIALLDY